MSWRGCEVASRQCMRVLEKEKNVIKESETAMKERCCDERLLIQYQQMTTVDMFSSITGISHTYSNPGNNLRLILNIY